MDDITKFSRYVRVSDPAGEAWKKVLDAGEDDAAYEAANRRIRKRGASDAARRSTEDEAGVAKDARLAPGRSAKPVGVADDEGIP
jgi:hypothetical protein